MCTTKRTMPGRRVERRRIGDRSIDPVYALREKIGGDDRVVNWWEGGRNCCNIDVTTNIILALPGPAENVQVSDITATSVKLTWSYKDPDEVQYYVIQHKPKHVNQAFAEISGITTMYYHVRSLSPYTEYELYVIVVNAIGRGPPSAPVTVTTGETSQYFLFLLAPPPPPLYLRIFSFSHFIHWRTRTRVPLRKFSACFRLSARLSSHRREIRSGISGARFESRSNENFATPSVHIS